MATSTLVKKLIPTLLICSSCSLELNTPLSVAGQHQNRKQIQPSKITRTTTVDGNRIALIIGNKDYKDSPLFNPLNDARDMKSALKSLGFTVVYRENADLPQIDAAVHEFRNQLTPDSIGLVYYSGHGVQADGVNYLIPVRTAMDSKAELKARAYDVGILLDEMQAVGNPVNIVILDACRNNPFRKFRGGARGLTSMSGPRGSLIAFATAPNSVAQDGTGRNGLYTKYLKQWIVQPGLRIQDVFIKVRESVLEESSEQTPWENSSLTGTLCLAGCDSSTVQSVTEVRQNTLVTNDWETPTVEQSVTPDSRQETQTSSSTDRFTATESNQDSQTVGNVTGSKNIIQYKVDGDVHIDMGN